MPGNSWLKAVAEVRFLDLCRKTNEWEFEKVSDKVSDKVSANQFATASEIEEEED